MSGDDRPSVLPTRRKILHSGILGAGVLGGCLEGIPNGTGSDPDDTVARATPTDTNDATDTRTSSDDEDVSTGTGDGSTPPDEDADQGDEAGSDEPTARGDWGSDWRVEPSAWSSSTPGCLTCDDEDARRYSQGFAASGLSWGDGANWEMRIDETSVDRGDAARIRLANVTDEARGRGANSKYNLQIETNAGWEDVRVYENQEQRGPHPAILHHTDAGDYHEWELTMDEAAIAGQVCPALRAGRYRFVYWGFQDGDGDEAVGVGFNFTP